jgi:hypothetical protein
VVNRQPTGSAPGAGSGLANAACRDPEGGDGQPSSPHDRAAAVIAAHDVLASPGLYDELTRLLAARIIDIYERSVQDRAWALDIEDEADRAGADAARARAEMRVLRGGG